MKPGSKVRVELWRKGARRDVALTIGELAPARIALPQPQVQAQERLGVAVRPLTEDESRAVGVSGGLLVQEAGGPAAQAGIQEGDIIVAVNGAPVKSNAQLAALLARSGKVVALLVQRGNNRVFVPVELG
jgi:serine protease Do